MLHGLPLIATSKTSIAGFCPSHLTGREQCEVTRYRTIDGTCNNLQHPSWGSARTAFRRLLAPHYLDGTEGEGKGSSLHRWYGGGGAPHNIHGTVGEGRPTT